MRDENYYKDLCPYVERAKQGDEKAFEYLYRHTYDQARLFVLNFCGNVTEAEDILQDVFMDIYRNLSSLKDNMAFCAWQRQIAYRCCLRHVKKNSQSDVLGNEVVDLIQSVSSKEAEPQDVILEDEKTKILYQCIQSLPDKQRAAIILSALEQLKMKEIAEIMDCNVNAVKNLLFHARKNLKKQIENLPKADREALKLRGFGFFTLYPLLRGSLPLTGSNAGKGAVIIKKAVLGAAVAVGVGTASFVMLQEDPLPSADFGGIETPEVELEPKGLEGIKIPKKPKPVVKKVVPASIRSVQVEKKTKRLAIYVAGDVDYEKTYAASKAGKRLGGLTCDTGQGILYLPSKTDTFRLHLMDKAGNERIFEFDKD